MIVLIAWCPPPVVCTSHWPGPACPPDPWGKDISILYKCNYFMSMKRYNAEHFAISSKLT